MIFKKAPLVAAMLASFGLSQAQARKPIVVVVNGTDNPYLANQPSGTTCCGGDVTPDESPILALTNLTGGETLTFTTTGSVGYEPGGTAPTADGYPDQKLNMQADYGTGISGPRKVYTSGLVGVFTTSATPTDPAPVQIKKGIAFKRLKPLLSQIFWIGDGLTGTGSGIVQKFTVPAGATSLYLGAADGFGWANNTGQITVSITIKPPHKL